MLNTARLYLLEYKILVVYLDQRYESNECVYFVIGFFSAFMMLKSMLTWLSYLTRLGFTYIGR